MTVKNALLLPSGLYDLLPPDARMESRAAELLLTCFTSFGYAQVSPPLLEFEASLLSGRGEALGQQTFRVMDPMSQSMMGFRADITLQVARIATSRLTRAPRPLRLCYAGPILQVKPDALKNDRQLMQAGIELIGTESPLGDAEVMMLAAEALMALGVDEISIDINLPGLLAELCPEAQNDAALRIRIKDAVRRRDGATIASLPVRNAELLSALLDVAGPAAHALSALEKLNVAQTATLKEVIARVEAGCPQITLTLDPLEYRGFDYHQGIGFSIFARGLRHELGRGGRYPVNGDSATGFTLYVTHILQLLEAPTQPKRILVSKDTSADAARTLRKEGWVAQHALTDAARTEAQHLGFSHIFDKGKIESV